MTPNQQRFKDELIGSTAQPSIYESYFDFESRNIILDRIDIADQDLSDGQLQMLYFFANVWLGENKYPFDFFYSASKLDQHNRQIIIDWLDDVFWP
jgi:hypothetical protein